MCAPSDLKQRIDPSDFERFELGTGTLYIQRELLSEGVIEFSIPEKGGFSITVKRGAG
jgi:hypothetical protein